jgi:PAS domain S-box-containing protein
MNPSGIGANESVTHERSRLPRLIDAQRYGLAVLSVGVALGVALLLQFLHFRGAEVPLLLFAVAIASWYGGTGPGVLALALSISGFYYYFVEPVRTIYIYRSEIPFFIIFVGFAALLTWFSTIRRRAEKGLRDQADLLNLTHDTIFVMDMEGVIKYWNRGAEERYGWTAEQALGKVVHDMLKTVFPSPLEEIEAEVRRTGRWEGELLHTKKDGTQVVVASRWSLQRDERGTPVAILETNNDITERKRAEEALRRLNRELRALSDCNQVLLRASDEQSLLNEICRIVCQEAGYRMAWAAYADHDEAKSVRPVAWSGTEEGYLANLGITWADTERGRGPTGTAIRSGKTCCIEDFTTDPRIASWRDSDLLLDFRSGIALPLKDERADAFGSLTVYSAEPNAFASEEIRLLEELAADLAFGIVTLRSRAARKRAEEQVALLSFALDNVREAAFLVDESGRFHYVNEEGCRALGYARAELLGMGVPDIDVEFPAGRWSDHWRDLKAQQSLNFESSHRTRDGRIFPVEISANYLEYGGVAYNLALVRDITERKRAEVKMQQQEMELRQVLDITPQLVGVFGPDRERLYVNRPALDYFGVTLEEWQSISDPFWFFHPGDRERVAKDVYSGPASDVPHEYEARLRRRDGAYLWFLFRDSPLRDDQGRIVRWYLAATDIEDRKQAEEKRQAQIWFLESMDRINRAMQGTNDLEQVTGDVIEAMLTIFDSERAFLYYPCDPDAPSFEVVMQRARPEYAVEGGVIRMTPDTARGFQIVLASSGVVTFGPGCDHPLVGDFAKRFGHKSSIGIALYPKTGKPWVLVMHQCSHSRVWTPDERKLLEEIARRLADSLTSLLMFRNQRESEEALRQSQAYLAEAQRLSHTGSWALNADTREYTYWSEEMFRIFGVDPREGVPPREAMGRRIHPEDWKRAHSGFEKSLKEKVDTSDEYRFVLPDGTVKHIHAIRHPVVNAAGVVVELMGSFMDITERKRAEEALRESETRFRTFVDHAGDALFVQDFEQGTIVDVNRQACESLGYTRQELIGNTAVAFHLDSERVEMESVAEGAAAGETVFKKHSHRRKDGSTFPVEVHTSLFWYGGRRFLLNIARDISDRVRAEQERERLRQLEADLAHTNRVGMMGELSASIAHEINQPLSGIVSNGSACLRWLAGDPPNLEEARENARHIVRDGKRAGDVIVRIRALAAKTATAKVRLDMNEVLQEVIALARDELHRSGAVLRTEFPDDLSTVLGDRVELQQVVLNLIMNGIEAMSAVGDRPRELVIRTQNDEGDQVRVTVQDSGIGLKPQSMERIFDAFYTTKQGGMGMGLAISRSIIQHHGGRLWAAANDGPGTTFQFTLPKYH